MPIEFKSFKCRNELYTHIPTFRVMNRVYCTPGIHPLHPLKKSRSAVLFFAAQRLFGYQLGVRRRLGSIHEVRQVMFCYAAPISKCEAGASYHVNNE